MSDLCRICGCTFDSPSFGGPGICPACDCGHQPVEAQRKEIERLKTATAQLASALESCVRMLSGIRTVYDDDPVLQRVLSHARTALEAARQQEA